jgi:hypothetical protein
MRALLPITAMLCLPLCASQAEAPKVEKDTEFRVKLLAPLSTQTNVKGDKITAQVISPPQFAGWMMEGEVRESKSGKKIKGTSVLNFTFHTLAREEQRIAVDARIKSFYNSKGQADADEEGRVIEKKSNAGKAAIATGAGAVIGGILGGGKGALIGAGAGGAASLLLIQVAAKGANVEFAAGSEVVLSVQERAR